jgi:hypothetical protein
MDSLMGKPAWSEPMARRGLAGAVDISLSAVILTEREGARNLKKRRCAGLGTLS